MKSAAPSWDVTRIMFAVAAIGGLIAASFWVLKPFLPSAIWAVMIVIATWPEMRMVQKRLWGRRSLAVAVMTAAMLATVLVPVAIAVTTLVDRADEIAAWTRSLVGVSVPRRRGLPGRNTGDFGPGTEERVYRGGLPPQPSDRHY